MLYTGVSQLMRPPVTHSLPADVDIRAAPWGREVVVGTAKKQKKPRSVPHCHRSMPQLLKETVQGKRVIVARAAILVRSLRLGAAKLGPQLLPTAFSGEALAFQLFFCPCIRCPDEDAHSEVALPPQPFLPGAVHYLLKLLRVDGKGHAASRFDYGYHDCPQTLHSGKQAGETM